MKSILSLLTIIFLSIGIYAQQQSMEINPNAGDVASGVNIGDFDVPGNKITLEALINMKYMATDTLGHGVVTKFLVQEHMNYVLRTMRFAITTDVDGYHRLTHGYPIQPNRWYHIAGVYDGAYMYFYVNGCLVKQEPHTGNLMQNDVDAMIGNRGGIDGINLYRGQIDEVRIWNVARTEAQIRANMTGSVPNNSPGLQGYYKFDGNYNNSAQNIHHGTAYGTDINRISRIGTMPTDFNITSALATPNPLPCVTSNSATITINATPSTDASYSQNGAIWQNHPNNVLSGYGAGTHTVFAKSAEGCVKQTTVTITGSPIAVAGGASVNTTNVCQGSTLYLSTTGTVGNIQWQESIDGGITWSNINGATTSFSSVVASTSGTIQYRAFVSSGGCNPDISNVLNVIVDPAPSAGTLSGANTICADGNPVVYTASQAGGTWTTSNSAIATVNNFGSVTGNANGTVTLTYTVPGSGSCVSVQTTKTIAVYSLSVSGTVSANSSAFCAGDNLSLSLTGHTGDLQWESSSDNGASYTPIAGATTTPYVVNNLTASTTHYKVKVQNGNCPQLVSNDVVVTVHPIPDPGTISGGNELCEGSALTLISSQSGGAWTSNNSSTAIVNASTGVVTGVSQGTVTFVYTLTQNGCADSVSKTLTIHALPDATISGDPIVCLGAQNTLTTPTADGTWSSDNTNVATVFGGQVNALAQGTATVSYAVTSIQGCNNSHSVTVTVLSTEPPILNGQSDLCLNATDNLTANMANGTWTSSNPAVASIEPNSGQLNALSPGTTILTYLITSGNCTATNTKEVNVHAYPNPGTLIGIDSICQNGVTTFFPSVANGTWHVHDPSIAQVDNQGNISGLLIGTTSVVYVLTSNVGCTDSVMRDVVVKPLPNPGLLSGTDVLCLNVITNLTPTVNGGQWSSSDPTVAMVSSDGAIGAVGLGTAVITYRVTENGCSSSVSKGITVTTTQSGTIDGDSLIVEGDSSLFVATWPNGTWSTNEPNLVNVDALTGMLTALQPGIATIVYRVTDNCGTATVIAQIEVEKKPREPIVPQVISPNGDGLNDSWMLEFLEEYPNNVVTVYNRWGTKVYEQKGYNKSVAFAGKSNQVQGTTEELPNSTYFYIIDLNDKTKTVLKGFVELQK